MDQIRARSILTQMWTTVFNARNRKLADSEVFELRMLCREMKGGVPGFDRFNSEVESVCSSLRSLIQLQEADDDYVVDLLLKLSHLLDLIN